MVNKKGVPVIILGLVMVLFLGAQVVSATKYGWAFDFSMAAGGGARATVNAQKSSDGNAKVNFSSVQNSDSLPVVYRLRSAANGSYASDLKTVTGTGDRTVAYYSGYGIVKYKYYMRMQTQTMSTHSATVKGSWQP